MPDANGKRSSQKNISKSQKAAEKNLSAKTPPLSREKIFSLWRRASKNPRLQAFLSRIFRKALSVL